LKNCPICRGKLEHKKEDTVYEYKGKSVTISQPAEYCLSCGESFLSADDIKATKKDIVDFKRSVDHLLKTKEIKSIRKKLKLTQQEASKIFGGGIRSFYKYETGENNPHRSLDILLRLIDKKKIDLDDVLQVS
jgi:HTH-type transcriptional regulator/antitoxin MqsA